MTRISNNLAVVLAAMTMIALAGCAKGESEATATDAAAAPASEPAGEPAADAAAPTDSAETEAPKPQ